MSLLHDFRANVIFNNQSCYYMVNTFREYVKKQKERFVDWVTKASNEETIETTDCITVTMPYLSYRDAVYCLTPQNYRDALNGNSATIAVVTDPGSTQQYSAKTSDDVLNSIENLLSDLQTQEIFLDYLCQSQDTVNTNEFLTRVSAIAPGIASAGFSLYTKILDVTNDKLEALKQFFKSKRDTEIYEAGWNDTLNVYKRSDYTGSVWSSVFSQIVTEVSDAVNKVITAVHSIGDLLSNIVKAIGAVAAWAARKMFSNLATDFEKVQGTRLGILDMPFIQMNLTGYGSGTRDFNPTLPVYIDNAGTGDNYVNRIWQYVDYYLSNDYTNTEPLVSRWTYNNQQITGDATYYRFGFNAYRFKNAIYNTPTYKEKLVNGLLKKVIYQDAGSASGFTRIFEVALPWQSCLRKTNLLVKDYILRFGWDDNQDLCFQLFAGVNQDEWASQTDENINMHLASYQLFEASLLANLEAWCPIHNDTSWSYDHMISTAPSDSDYNRSFVTYLSPLCDLSEQRSYVLTSHQKALIGAILLYSMLQACDDNDILATYNSNNMLFSESETTFNAVTALSYGRDITDLDPIFNSDTYRPYSSESVTGPSVHYQTVAERANEIVHIINIVLLAAVVAIVAYKVSKLVKNRRIKLDLLNGQYDSLTWSYYDAQTSGEKTAILNQLRKVRKKKIHTERLNTILGITSPSLETPSLVSRTTDLLQDMVGDNGKQKDYTQNFQDVEGLIH